MRLTRVAVAAAAAAAVAVSVAGCGDDSFSTGPSGTAATSTVLTFDEAAAQMRELVDSTVAEVFSGADVEVRDEFDRQGCGSETEEEFVDYVLTIEVPASEMDAVIAAVSERWAALGSEDDDPGRGVTFEFDGYGVGLSLFPDDDRVTIGGSTDCYPPP